MKRLACLAALLFCACSSGDTPAEATADEFIQDCDSAAAGGAFTSDEALADFINAEASGKVTSEACKFTELVSPARGENLSAKTPPSIRFNDTPGSCAAAPIRPRTGLRRMPRTRPAYSRVLEALLASITRDAKAHCAAVNGTNYYFKVLPQGGTTALYTAMLSVTSFTPDAAKWQKAMSGRSGQTVNIVIERAVFLRGDINQGPFAMQPVNFVVGQ